MRTFQHFDIASRNRLFRSWDIAAVVVWLFAAPSSILAGEGKPGKPAPDGDSRRVVYLVPNFHPACCGWLTDWSTERNYCANNYIDHLDRVRNDSNYAFALSEVPNMIAMFNFHPERKEELIRRFREGRAEPCNAFFLESTINLPGGEALVKNGVEGLRWQSRVLGVRPRYAWMIDVTGTHEQMAQITAGLGLDALFYTRHNPTGSTVHWAESPDGTRVLAIAPGHYSEWNPLFKTTQPLDETALRELKDDLDYRMGLKTMTPEEIEKRPFKWDGMRQRAPEGAPVLILAGNGDYSVAPAYKGYPTEFLRQFKSVAPLIDLAFVTPGKYVDAILPAARSGAMKLPTMKGGTKFSFNAFWMENPRVKTAFRRAEQDLQAAEMLSTVASLESRSTYPVQPLYHAWLMLLLNMDRNSLWGSAGGMVFEHPHSWDVRDRYEAVGAIARRTSEEAIGTLFSEGSSLALFNQLNWDRRDPILVNLPEGGGLKGVRCQAVPGTPYVLCRPALPSVGTVSLEPSSNPPELPISVPLPDSIDTRFYRARIDRGTGALTSLKLKPSGREILGGPANVIVAEKPKTQTGDPGDHILDRPERLTLANSSGFPPRISVQSGPLATTVEVESGFYGDGRMVRTIRFYDDYPRIDFETELNNIPDSTVVAAEFPLSEEIVEIRRGIPYGFSHGAWSRPNPGLHGWTKGIVPAVRWSHYAFAGGGGVALLDRGLSGREVTGKTPIIFLLNATDKYYGYDNPWLSGKGKHKLEYALVAHDSAWDKARIPQLAWEFNCPPVALPNCGKTAPRSFVKTSENVIVEAIRREGSDIELRMAECLGIAGYAEVKLSMPHGQVALTDLAGANGVPLKPASVYRFPVRPQQIVTMRFRTGNAVAEIQPLTDWNPLVPEAKRAALNTRIDKKGHPPRGDAPKDPGSNGP